ncbi:MAG TPA: hypothetical protein VF021_08030, partial [Longimicrobiales bacterium]
LPDAQVVVPELTLMSMESRQVPVVVRLPARDAIERTLPLRVRVTAESGQRVLDTTFKTGRASGTEGT